MTGGLMAELSVLSPQRASTCFALPHKSPLHQSIIIIPQFELSRLIDFVILGSSSFVSRYAGRSSFSGSQTRTKIGRYAPLRCVTTTSDPFLCPCVLSSIYIYLHIYAFVEVL